MAISRAMKTSIPRLHSVRLKAGGAKLRIMHSQREQMSRELRCTLQYEADKAWEYHQGMVVGFSLVIWTANGDAASALYNTHLSPLPNSAIPHLVAESARGMITKTQIDGAQDDSA